MWFVENNTELILDEVSTKKRWTNNIKFERERDEGVLIKYTQNF